MLINTKVEESVAAKVRERAAIEGMSVSRFLNEYLKANILNAA